MTVAAAPHLRRLGFALVAATLVVIAFATLTPEPPVASESHFCLLCGSFGTVDALLNVLLFVPLGIGLLLSGASAKRAILTTFAISVVIELAQFFLIPGRDSTIGDVVTNTVGGATGFALARHANLLLRPPPNTARKLALAWASIWLVLQIVSAFGLSLSLPDTRYYGQLARTLGSFVIFRGNVIVARVGDIQIPNTAISDSHHLRQLLIDGNAVTTTVLPAGPPHGLAPIVRIADEREREILLVAQSDEGFVFGIHTGAATLRLRSPLFLLPGAFPVSSLADSPGDTVRLSARFSRSEIGMSAGTSRRTAGLRLTISGSMGWTLWLPFQWLIAGTPTELVASWVWMACLVIPLGYWWVWLPRSPPKRAAFLLMSMATLLVAGLALVPRLLELSAARPGDWLATLAGLVAGGLGANRVATTLGQSQTDA